MLKEERFFLIIKELKETSKVTYEALATKLEVSEDTIRRDIQLLHKAGLLIRVRGGAILPNYNPLSFQDRTELFSDGKKVIALKAIQLLKNIRTVFIDGGTTTLTVAASLPLDIKLRVVTNNVGIPAVLSAHEYVDIVLLGGVYNRNANTTTGLQTCMEIEKFQADLYFMGTCAIDADAGITAAILEDGEVKKAFLASATKTVVLANHEKLNTTDFFRVSSLMDVDIFVTDLPSNSDKLESYRRFDLEIL